MGDRRGYIECHGPAGITRGVRRRPNQGRSARDMTAPDTNFPTPVAGRAVPAEDSVPAEADSAPLVSHNSEINTTAAMAHRCGMTHLASGRLCLLPERHPGSCDFVEPADVEAKIAGS